ncbi:MAG: prephenate dehydrogenase/arogenate dehydrogenase family protein [Pseudomonadota bacterium]
MSHSVESIAVLGLGLIGGSLARALRQNGFARRVVGYGRRQRSLQIGMELGVIDSFTLDLDEVLDQCDMVVIGAPTLVAAELVKSIFTKLPGRVTAPVITDVASVKGNLKVAALESMSTFPPNLVLAHPIAGSEKSGVEASSADLFLNHRVILTPEESNSVEAVELVCAMWRSVGAEVVKMSVAEHDKVLAATSHLPHMLAYALVDALASAEANEDIFRFAAGGFRDFTRIASSDPVMWRDIAIANQTALLQSIDMFAAHLADLRTAVADANGDQLHATFERAKAARDQFAIDMAGRNQRKRG